MYHKEYRKLRNQARFVQEIMEGKLVVNRKKKAVLVQELRERKYEAFPKNAEKKKKTQDQLDEDEGDDDDGIPGGNDYDYLLTMPIYSLTQERLDRLQAQIAAKKKEHDDLEALSEKDLWCKDLDDFVVEWEAQLALDNEIQSNIRRLGRRVSKKIGAGRGRKDKDDDEYNPILKKAAKATAKTAKVETKTHERFAEKFLGASKASKPSSSAPVKDESDGFSDGDYAMLSRNKPAAKPTDDADGEARRGRRTAASKPAKYAEESESDFNDDDDDDDGFTFKPTSTVTTTKVPVAKPSDASDGEAAKPKQRLVSSTVAPSRTKPVWLEDDSDTDGSRLLGDVGAMVKGIGKSDTEGANGNGGRLSLFAMSTSRPESSHGSALPKTIRTKPSRNFDDDGPDDTNYEMLAKSPQRGPSGAALTGVDLVNSLLSDDDDMPPVKGPTAAVAKVSVNTAASLVKNPKRRPAGTTAASKTKSNPAPATSQPKAVQLSPAAKAFAQKKAKKTFSFSDDEDDAPARSAAAPPARERPARAAASKPKKPLYVDSDDDDDFGGGDDGDDYDMSD